MAGDKWHCHRGQVAPVITNEERKLVSLNAVEGPDFDGNALDAGGCTTDRDRRRDGTINLGKGS
jgi:hypothetical protein